MVLNMELDMELDMELCKELDLDIQEKYDSIRDKYPIIVKGIRIHRWPDSNIIFAPYTAEKTRYVFESRSMNTLNETGVMILENCNGIYTTKELIYQFATKFKMDKVVVANKLVRFLIIANDYLHHITFEDYPNTEPIICEYTGSKEFITPVHFSIELTTRCNLRCKHCYRSSSPTINEEELSYDEIINILQMMYDIGARHIEVTGGEMFLHPRIKDILTFICDRFEFIGLLTNGSVLSDEMIQYLNQFKEKLVWSVSLDSYDEETHDNFRGGKGAFKRTVNAIKKLTGNGHAVRVSMSVTDVNIYQVERTLDFVRDELKADWFGFNYVLPYGRGKDLMWNLSQEDMSKRVTEIDKYTDNFPGFTNKYSEQQVTELKERMTNCGAGWRTLTISPKGNIRPCVLMEEGFVDLGNIKISKIDEVMKQPLINHLMDLPWPLEKCCSKCENESFCKFCAYRGIITNKERLKQGLGLCKWAIENRLDAFLDLEREVPDNNSCMTKFCSITD